MKRIMLYILFILFIIIYYLYNYKERFKIKKNKKNNPTQISKRFKIIKNKKSKKKNPTQISERFKIIKNKKSKKNIPTQISNEDNQNEIMTSFDYSFNEIPRQIKEKYIHNKKNIFLYKEIKEHINNDNIKDDDVCYYTYENPQIEQVYNYGLYDPSGYIYENNHEQLDTSYNIYYDEEYRLIHPYQKKIYYCDNIDDNLPECSYLSCNKYNKIEKHMYKMKDNINSIRDVKINEARIYLKDKKDKKRIYYDDTEKDIISYDEYLKNNLSEISKNIFIN